VIAWGNNVQARADGGAHELLLHVKQGSHERVSKSSSKEPLAPRRPLSPAPRTPPPRPHSLPLLPPSASLLDPKPLIPTRCPFRPFNPQGQCGVPGSPLVVGPTLVPGTADEHVVVLSAGPSHCATVTECGTVLTWGNSKYGRLGHPAAEVREGRFECTHLSRPVQSQADLRLRAGGGRACGVSRPAHKNHTGCSVPRTHNGAHGHRRRVHLGIWRGRCATSREQCI